MNAVMTARARWRLMFWSCAVVVLALALMPAAPHVPTTGWDKSNHLLAFSVMTVLGHRAYPGRIAAVLAGLALYGGLIEVLQFFTPDRSAEWADLGADVVGIFVGYGASALLKKFGRSGRSG
jgi:VanZ family protein